MTGSLTDPARAGHRTVKWGAAALLLALSASAAAETTVTAKVSVASRNASLTGPPALADRVVIEKRAHRMSLYAGNRLLAAYQVALGNPVGRKLCQGDKRTPEGIYQVVGRKEDSQFHRALRLSYPSIDDAERARSTGCDPGGDIMIHGLKYDYGPRDNKLHRRQDWTKGCVAVTNEEIEQIWGLVPDGTEVVIRP
jgi:murein L,D-transpeptidase YafK